jgi:hypothetical protein|eukprot:COSAG06_NODE_9873_length_1800_cov_3.576471_1_plen_267_part_00
MPRYAAPKRVSAPTSGSRTSGSGVRGTTSASSRGGGSQGSLSAAAAPTNLLSAQKSQRPQQGAAQEQLSRISIAPQLGIPSVPFAQRINVGLTLDDSHKFIQPDADFSCCGWLLKKGGIRKNWLGRFFELDSSGTLRYSTFCIDKPVKQGGSTKTQLCGHDEKGAISLRDAEDIRMSTAPNAEPGEIEVVTSDRTYRVFPGGDAGTDSLDNLGKVKAGHTWCLCMNLAKLAAGSDMQSSQVLSPEVLSSAPAAKAQQAARDLASLA